MRRPIRRYIDILRRIVSPGQDSPTRSHVGRIASAELPSDGMSEETEAAAREKNNRNETHED